MARRILNRKDLRNDYDAAERRKETEEERDEDEEELEDEDEEEEGEEGEEGDEDEDEDEEGELDEDEEAPKKKKKPAKVAKPKAAKPRSRAAKAVRMRVVWGVFNNSNNMVTTYEYPKKAEAEAHAARLTQDKRSTHFIQPVKEPIEEKKEK